MEEQDKIDAPLPPEEDLNLEGTFRGLDGQSISWLEVDARESGLLNLRKSFGADLPRQVIAYALTFAYSPNDRNATLMLGTDDQVAVWINGEAIHRANVRRRSEPDQDSVNCRLKAGWNRVLFKNGRRGGRWTLYARLSDPDSTLKYDKRPNEN